MKKINNDDGNAVVILTGLLFSIIFSSVVIAFLLMQVYGVSAVVPELPTQNDVKVFSNKQGFVDGAYDLSTIVASLNSKWVNRADVGMVLSTLSTGDMSYIAIDNIQKDTSGLYQNTYVINNSATNILGRHGDYCILLRYTGGVDQNEVCFTSDGVKIPTYLINAYTQWGNRYFLAYPDINQIERATIKTVYNDINLKVTVYFNGDKLIETTSLSPDSNIMGLWGRYYGGVGSWILGFTLESFETLGGIVDVVTNNGQDILGSIAGFIGTILKIVLWNVDSAFLPLELNIIFIKTQLAGIIVCVISIIRGSG